MNICTPEVAKQVLDRYLQATRTGNDRECLKIEQDFGMDGYSPEVVLVGLNALCEGKDHFEAIEDYFDNVEGDCDEL